MSQKEMDEIFSRHTRAEETVNIPVQRYTIDGSPVCFCWAGDKKRERKVCMFLGAVKFGTQDMCMALAVYIYDNKPVERCPVWYDIESAQGQERNPQDEGGIK